MRNLSRTALFVAAGIVLACAGSARAWYYLPLQEREESLANADPAHDYVRLTAYWCPVLGEPIRDRGLRAVAAATKLRSRDTWFCQLAVLRAPGPSWSPIDLVLAASLPDDPRCYLLAPQAGQGLISLSLIISDVQRERLSGGTGVPLVADTNAQRAPVDLGLEEGDNSLAVILAAIGGAIGLVALLASMGRH